ncbi:hypothetical protein Ae201684P_021092 [Aphanomyces euteiches]|nr:hypothetical protein Ae201684P_021092 [Aphanomyces euteiches]KAH9139138.1 hypothetical protein AeRB84_016584 [Aphanomyces euteiches]
MKTGPQTLVKFSRHLSAVLFATCALANAMEAVAEPNNGQAAVVPKEANLRQEGGDADQSKEWGRWGWGGLVWWIKHQLGHKHSRDTPKHTPQDASRREISPLGTHLPRAHLDPIKTPTRHVWHV